MADESLSKPPVDAGALRQELATLRAVQAPVIYFDYPSNHGAYLGMGNITLECGLHLLVDGRVINGRQVVAHLRFPLSMIPLLRNSLDQIELAAQPPASEEKN